MDVIVSKFNSTLCGRNTTEIFVPHVGEFHEKVDYFHTMFAVPIGDSYSVLTVVIKVVVAS